MKNLTFQQLKHYIAIFCIGIFCSMGIGGCSQENDLAELPEATDDATLLASQLKLLQTRATNATNTILITTAKSVNFTVENNSPIIVDWGDGNNDIDVFAHTYTDDLPVHTICFNGAQDAIQELNCYEQEVIFLNVTKNTSLTRLHCNNNRISQLDISENKDLTYLVCSDNLLSKLSLNNNTKLEYLICSRNKLDSIDVSHLSKLAFLACDQCNLKKIDISNNLNLSILKCYANKLTQIDVSSNTILRNLYIDDNQLKTLDLINNSSLVVLSSNCNGLTNINFPDSSSLSSILCEDNHLNDLILPTKCPNLRFLYCSNNDFFFDPDTDVTFSKLLALISSLPQKTTGSGLISVSETIDTEMLKDVAKRKNWSLVTK